jgi:salicylate 5-hydroxylase small subunit
MNEAIDLQTWFELSQLYADPRAGGLDSDQWPEFSGRPASPAAAGEPRARFRRPCRSRAGDAEGPRTAFATLFHDPYYQRHIAGMPVVRNQATESTARPPAGAHPLSR